MLGIDVPVFGLDDLVWLVVCSTMVLLMQAGFCLLESGMVRTKNTINVAFKNLSDFIVSALLYATIGFSLMYGVSIGGMVGNGAIGLGLTSTSIEADAASSWIIAFFLFNMMFCGTATTIISGAVAERIQLSGYIAITVLVAGIIYPIFGHWAWASGSGGEGWLKSLGLIDFAGGLVVHSLGGWIALAAVLIVGPRLGFRNRRGIEIQGHNMTLATLGMMLLWFGWFGFNGGSTLGFDARLPLIIANTTMAGAGGGVVSLLWPLIRGSHANLKDLVIGTICGLVAITPSCHIVTPVAACLIGCVGSALGMYAATMLRKRNIDDALGAFPSHAIAGSWGALAVALFGQVEAFGGLSRMQQLGVQGLGVFACMLWAFGVGGALLWLLNYYWPLRVSAAEERYGLNLSEHGVITDVVTLLNELEGQMVPSMSGRIDPHSEIGKVALKYSQLLKRANHLNTPVTTIDHQQLQPNRMVTRPADGTLASDRQQFNDRLLHAIKTAGGSSDRRFILLLVAIDSLDSQQHTMNEEAVGELMRQVSERQRELLQMANEKGLMLQEAVSVRVDASVLAILLEGVSEKLNESEFARSLHTKLALPFTVSGREVSANPHIGWVLGRSEHQDVNDVLNEAELALYKARTENLGVVGYDEAMQAEAVRRLRLEMDLRSALDNEEFNLLYRPIYDVAGERPYAIEAKIRWLHPTHGELLGSDFMQVAEESGMIAELGDWVIDQAITQLSHWQRKNTDASPDTLVRLAVNVSEQQVMSDSFLEWVRECLLKHNVDARHLLLEVNDSLIRPDDQALQRQLRKYKAMGIGLAIDGFGTGRTSLSSLCRLPIDTLKLSPVFSREIGTNAPHRWVSKTIIGLAAQLGMKVIAEGVDNSMQQKQFSDFGCRYQQGSMFAEAMTADELDEWLYSRSAVV